MAFFKLAQCEKRIVEDGRVCCPVTSIDVDIDLCHDCPNLDSFQDSGAAATIHCRTPNPPDDAS